MDFVKCTSHDNVPIYIKKNIIYAIIPNDDNKICGTLILLANRVEMYVRETTEEVKELIGK